MILVKDDADVFIFEFRNQLFRVGNSGDVGESGISAVFCSSMTDHNSIAGKGHFGDIMVGKAVTKFTVISLW